MKKIGKSRHSLGVFSLAMIAIVSVDSLRNLPIAAQYGFSLVIFYIVAGLIFFLPLAWVTARLAAMYPITGGSYVWVSTAFGNSWGYLAIWLQWLYNMIWYPTIFSFISSILASLIYQGGEHNKLIILSSSLGFFWLISFLHAKGMRTTSWISTGSAILGTLFPMFLIIALGAYWLGSGKPSATVLSWETLWPGAYDFKNIGYFANILFSLLGLEVIAMHAGNVSNPAKTYPKAVAISSVIILITIICSSLALCIIMPVEKIVLLSGLMDVLQFYFAAYHITNVAALIGICIIIGGLGIASSWMIGMARGLHVSLCNMNAPAWLQRLNKQQMPSGVILLQTIVYSILSSAFLLFPDINSSYWVLSVMTAQFALFYYILLFVAAIKLIRLKKLSPVNNVFSVLLPVLAIIACLLGIIVGFIPPDFIRGANKLKYELLLIGVFAIICLLPSLRFVYKWK